MSRMRRISMERTSTLLFRLALILLTINILDFVLIGYSFVIGQIFERESGDLFRVINSYALAVNESEESVPEEAQAVYEELRAAMTGVRRALVKNAELPPPMYSSGEEQEAYTQKVRDFAARIRRNSARVAAVSYAWIVVLILLSVATTLVLLLSMFAWRRNQSSFNRQLAVGFDKIEMLLKYQTPPEIGDERSEIAEIEDLHRIIARIASDELHNRRIRESEVSGNLNALMEDLFDDLAGRMSCDRTALAFLDSANNVIAETVVSSYSRTFLEPGYKEQLESTHLGEIIETKNSRIINDLPEYAGSTRVSSATKKLLEEGIKSSMTIPMFFNGKCLGFFFVSSREVNAYDIDTLNYTNRLINLIKQNLYSEFLLQQMVSEISNAFVTLMYEKDNETSSHIKRMSLYSHSIARSYHENIRRLTPRFMREILWYSPLHDIGKVGTPDAILLKNGPLNTSEMEIMKHHVIVGKRVMEQMNDNLRRIISFPLLQTALDIIHGHHEKFDGTGYPEGLRGDGIPLAGRIVALADVFDALTSKRPYKEAYSIEEALRIIEDTMRSSFDPDILKAFKLSLHEIQGVYDQFKEI